MELIQELQQMKNQVDQAKVDKAQAEGRLEGVMDRLEKEFGCTTVEQAKELRDKLTAEVNTLDEELREGVDALRTTHFN